MSDMASSGLSTDVALLLIGKTGNGKSTTGNSILKRKAFISKCTTSSVTTQIQSEVSEFEGRVIQVVDGPGVGDTRLDNMEAVELVMREITKAIAMNPQGYHAFLLVVKFGGRFTEEDKATVIFLRNVFGQDFVKRYCILVVTYGDLFEGENEETGLTFPAWCQEQEGVFQELYLECNRRALLFDNKTKDEKRRNAQIKSLLLALDNLSCSHHRYTDFNFQMAQKSRERIMVEAKIPMICGEMTKETSLILRERQRIDSLGDPQAKIAPLQALRARTNSLLDKLISEDRETGALHEQLSTLRAMLAQENELINHCERTIAEREELNRRREEMERRFREEQQRIENERTRQLIEMENQRREAERRRLEQEEAERRLSDELERARQQQLREMERKLQQERVEREQIFLRELEMRRQRPQAQQQASCMIL